jgi:hypothetical protein
MKTPPLLLRNGQRKRTARNRYSLNSRTSLSPHGSFGTRPGLEGPGSGNVVVVQPPAERHRNAAITHDEAAIRHEESATRWEASGDTERADLERRNAEIERLAAELERDRLALEEARSRRIPG